MRAQLFLFNNHDKKGLYNESELRTVFLDCRSKWIQNCIQNTLNVDEQITPPTRV